MITVTQPTVTTAEDGPGTPDKSYTVYNTYGQVTWTKDGDGYINYIQYNYSDYKEAIGALVKMITDVDTTITGAYQGPAPWQSLSGVTHAELVTQITVDALGRPTKVIDAKGKITYTVYLDLVRDNNGAIIPDVQEVRTYTAWNPQPHTVVGPVQVVVQYGASGITDTLTMNQQPTWDKNGHRGVTKPSPT